MAVSASHRAGMNRYTSSSAVSAEASTAVNMARGASRQDSGREGGKDGPRYITPGLGFT